MSTNTNFSAPVRVRMHTAMHRAARSCIGGHGLMGTYGFRLFVIHPYHPIHFHLHPCCAPCELASSHSEIVPLPLLPASTPQGQPSAHRGPLLGHDIGTALPDDFRKPVTVVANFLDSPTPSVVFRTCPPFCLGTMSLYGAPMTYHTQISS